MASTLTTASTVTTEAQIEEGDGIHNVIAVVQSGSRSVVAIYSVDSTARRTSPSPNSRSLPSQLASYLTSLWPAIKIGGIKIVHFHKNA